MRQFVKLLEELESTTSLNDKKAILAKYPDCKEMLRYALDPFMMFGVTSGNLSKFPITFGISGMSWTLASHILDLLANKDLTGHDALISIQEINNNCSPEYVDAFCRIIDKDLGCGVGVELVNSVFPKLVPQFSVQLCKAMEDMTKLPFKNSYVSRKLDGCRVITIIHGDQINFYSREGREFFTLDKVKEDLRKHYGPNNLGIVLDGEMCIMNGANEDFKAIVSEIKRKNHTIENPKYKIIDTLILEDFFNGQARETFEESLLRMTVNGQYFEVVEQIKVEKIEEVVTLLDHATEMGWEGLIIRDGDLPYKAKRHKGILKIKKFHDAEFTVVATFEGEGKYKGTLGGLTITGSVDGKEINSDVGSGFSDEDRARLWTMGGEIIGQMVTIKYFEISKNKDGEFSLRFPVFKVLHGRKREV